MTKKTLLVVSVLAGGALFAGSRAVQAGVETVAQFRAQGPQGLEKFWALHKAKIEARKARFKAANYASDAQWQSLSAQLDQVAGQRDAWSSRLYWFTDWEAAKAASKAQNKPILSLRMLGRLTDEYSCANSRFFRTALYANAKIGATLRDKYILHWSSERPVPVVTIDMGDGRIVKRTLTGNSAHYLLDSQGRPLDVLPGLYGPGAFQEWLEKGAALFQECNALEGEARREKLKAWHEGEINALAEKYIAEVKAGNEEFWKKAEPKQHDQLQKSTLQMLQNTSRLGAPVAQTVPAPRAGRLALGKSVMEIPVLNATELYRGINFSRDEMAYWTGLKPYLDGARLDENSRLLLRSQRQALDTQSVPQNGDPRFQPVPYRIADDPKLAQPPADPFERLVDNFERNIAVDTARNEWNFHAPLHQWFATREVNSFDELNRLVYDKLFLTPQSDPWLGLSPAGNYTGLTDSGLFNTAPQRQAKLAK
jgi:hypothetical protein